ncbi:MAG TPA: hypothetical protein DCW66_14490 [Sphingobacterium sp.]|nr:hypothetical protein [Sphingobacterium sp.]
MQFTWKAAMQAYSEKDWRDFVFFLSQCATSFGYPSARYPAKSTPGGDQFLGSAGRNGPC